MSSKQGSEETLGAKTYPNVAMARKQSGFESDRKHVEPWFGIVWKKLLTFWGKT